MRAMIMAAGKGTRLRPLTDLVPKPMVPIANRPALFHIIRLLRLHGFTDIVMNLHHLPEAISGYFGDGSAMGVQLTYSFEPQLLGTAGGVKKNQEFLATDTFLVVSGDALTDADLTGLVAAHKRYGSIATLAVKEVDDPSRYGVVVINDEGQVVGFQEKPPLEQARSRMCNCGIYVFEPEIFDYILPASFDDFGTRVFPDLLRAGVPFCAEEISGYWNDVGNLEAFLQGNADALTGKVEIEIPGTEVRPGVWLEEDSYVDGSVRMEPPVLLGRRTRVDKRVVIEGPAVLGDGCVVESDCHLACGVILSASLVPAGSVVAGGVLGRKLAEPGCDW